MNSDHLLAARTLRTELAPHWGRVGSFQWGKVINIHVGPPGTVDVKLDGSTVTTTNVVYLSTYAPQIGDIVIVGRMQGPAQTARFVIGALAGTAGVGNAYTLLGQVSLGAGTTTFTLPAGNNWWGIRLVFRNCTSSQAAQGDNVAIRFNGDTTAANYFTCTWDQTNNAGTLSLVTTAVTSAIAWTCLAIGTTVGSNYAGDGVFEITNAGDAKYKRIMGQTSYGDGATNQHSVRWGLWKSTAQLSTIGFLSGVGPGTNTLGGTVDIFGIPAPS